MRDSEQNTEQIAEYVISHQDFYRWLGNEIGLTADSLGTEIMSRLPHSTDPYMNDIPLRMWDAYHYGMRIRAGNAGMRSWSQSDTVCVLKALAREIKDGLTKGGNN